MACNCLCCGCVNCTEGQEGKCCCGGSSGACCQAGEFCCSGVCLEGGCECGCCLVDGEPSFDVTDAAECAETYGADKNICTEYYSTEPVSAEECPYGWEFLDGTCFRQSCVDDCETCVATQEGGWVACAQDPACPGDQAVWHDVCPQPICVTYTFSATPSGSGCDNERFNLQTIYAPDSCGLPVVVTITGSVDDDFAINGDIVQPNEFVNDDFPDCNPAHTVEYTFTLEDPSFDIEVVDNHGISVSADLTICFTPAAPPP